jgi:hypothetical protein
MEVHDGPWEARKCVFIIYVHRVIKISNVFPRLSSLKRVLCVE